MDDIRNLQQKKILILPMLTAFVTIFLLAISGSMLTTSSESDISPLEKGWSISRDNSVMKNVVLSEYHIGRSKRGDVITISNKIKVGSDCTTLMFKSKLSAIEVLIDNELMYSFGQDFFEKRMFIPKLFNFVTLNLSPGVHDITIKYTIGDDFAIRQLSPVFYGQKRDLIRAFFSFNRTTIFIGGFLIIYSCLLFSLWIYLLLTHRSALQVYISADFAMLLGCYIYSSNDILCIFGGLHQEFFSMLEYISFYLFPLAFSMLFYSLHSDVEEKKQKIIIVLNIVFPIIILILHFSGVVHLYFFRDFVGTVDVVEILILLPILIKCLKKQSDSQEDVDYIVGVDAEIYLMIGFTILVGSALLEILLRVIWGTNEDFTHVTLFTSINLFELGMLFFMVCHFIYYFINSINHMSAQRMKAQLEGLAYTDALTGLMNRAACSQEFANLQGDYAIVSLDLDNLKSVNDTFGHAVGDDMIKAFAKAFENSFSDAELRARTGGDEFIALFKNKKADAIEMCIKKFMDEMNHFNEGDSKFKLSASVGYAFSNEVESRKYADVFYLADQRMYRMKEAHHG